MWQDVFPSVGPKLDAEHERELRLVEQARAGADWALAALIARYQPPVTRYLTRLTGNPTAARTLAEQVFIRMERRLHGPQGGRQLRLWLLRACTEVGLEMLRRPRETKTPRLVESSRPMRLLPSGSSPAANFLRTGLGKLATMTGSTSRQVRKLIWSATPENETWSPRGNEDDNTSGDEQPEDNAKDGTWRLEEDETETLTPREALRHRMVRAVLAELPYGDAQCLALHLVAGLNQAEVALALGITPSATRKRIVHGLTLFAQRYEAAAASLGLPPDFFALQPERPEHVDTRLDSADQPLPLMEALADEQDVDVLTTNEHIAVQPFAHDESTLIWSGRIHRDMTTEAEAASTNIRAESESMIVETSLAHVGEPVEVPEPVAALPPAPDIPLSVRDVWVLDQGHEQLNQATRMLPLGLEEIILPASFFEMTARTAADAAASPEEPTDMPPHMAVQQSVETRLVPVLTAPDPAGTESADGQQAVSRATPVQTESSIRVVPVLTTASAASSEARIVPVLTASPDQDKVTLAHVLSRGEDVVARNHTAHEKGADASAHAPEHAHATLVVRGGTSGETSSEML